VGKADTMTSKTEQSPSGIRVLKAVCLFVCFWAILDLVYLVSGHAVYLSRYAFPENYAQRATSIVIGLSYAPLFYGVHRRLAVAWKFGWAILIATFSWFLVETLASILKQTPRSGRWVASGVMTIMISAVAIYWGRWWSRQKIYFSQRGL
jgi:hypothetical protein